MRMVEEVFTGNPAAGSLAEEWIGRLSGDAPRVLLADGDDERALVAATWLARNTPLRPILVSAEGRCRSLAADLGLDLSDVEVQTSSSLASDEEVMAVLGVRPDGAPRPEDEVCEMAQDSLYLAAAHVRAGKSDACVAGASRATSEVIRAGLKVIGLDRGVGTVSSCFLMVLPDGRRLAYGDCAVLPTPEERQLAEIAVATARTYQELTGSAPVVAMLSFSTMGSAKHPEVDRVVAATRVAQELRPDLCIDGELQFDAAMVESVGRSKASRSPVAGRANVLIFPNLAAGNIGYKMTERLGGAVAIGPVLQGLAAPLNDLSRGCSSDDIVSVALLSGVQAVERSARLDSE